MHYYNYQRYHYYSELNHLPYAQRYLILKDTINSLITLYRSDLSKKSMLYTFFYDNFIIKMYYNK